MTDSEHWLEERETEWEQGQGGKWPKIESATEILDRCRFNDERDLGPEWYRRDHEYQYRKGFYHGIAEAAWLVEILYRNKGYVRPKEIANILSNWTNELRRWKLDSLTESPLKEMGTPLLKQESWATLKRAAHERDGGQCTRCGSREELEAHHLWEVADGGLPELENLTTLCKDCHRPNSKTKQES